VWTDLLVARKIGEEKERKVREAFSMAFIPGTSLKQEPNRT
jgi:hypothetical protein